MAATLKKQIPFFCTNLSILRDALAEAWGILVYNIIIALIKNIIQNFRI
jgi:hypothetical protein